jgi:hypothetical protein
VIRFSDELWQGAADLYDAILAHPFLAGLTDGSLPESAFAFYVVQDALFLQRYAQALAAVASAAPTGAETEMFARHAAGIIAVERQLHDSLLGKLGISPASVDAAEPAPATLAYTSYLLAACRGGSYADGVAAVLLDLLGGRQGTAAPRLARPALPAVDRHLQRRRVRRRGPRRARRRRPARPEPRAGRARARAPALPRDQPLRVDVLGHGLPPGDLARLTGRATE